MPPRHHTIFTYTMFIYVDCLACVYDGHFTIIKLELQSCYIPLAVLLHSLTWQSSVPISQNTVWFRHVWCQVFVWNQGVPCIVSQTCIISRILYYLGVYNHRQKNNRIVMQSLYKLQLGSASASSCSYSLKKMLHTENMAERHFVGFVRSAGVRRGDNVTSVMNMLCRVLSCLANAIK